METGYREVKRRWISRRYPNGSLRVTVDGEITRKVRPGVRSGVEAVAMKWI